MGACTHSAGPVAFFTPDSSGGGWKGHRGWGSLPDERVGRARSRQGRLAPAGCRGVCPRPTLALCWERERLVPGALPVRGNPIRALVSGVGFGPGPGGLSLQPLHCSGRGHSPVLHGSSSRAMPVFFSSKASSHGIYWFFKCI